MKKLLPVLLIITVFFAGCTTFNNQNINNNDNNTDTDRGPTIAELVQRESQHDYIYTSNSSTYIDGRFSSSSNATAKISNSLNLILTINHKEDYDSYYLTDYNEMVARQWAPGYEFQGSEFECHGFSIADSPRKTLLDLNAEIVERVKMTVDGELVNCTEVVYYTYKTDSEGNYTDEVNLVYEKWLWDEYGVTVKYHVYRPYDIHTQEWEMTAVHSDFIFGTLSTEDFEYPLPCNIVD